MVRLFYERLFEFSVKNKKLRFTESVLQILHGKYLMRKYFNVLKYYIWEFTKENLKLSAQRNSKRQFIIG